MLADVRPDAKTAYFVVSAHLASIIQSRFISPPDGANAPFPNDENSLQNPEPDPRLDEAENVL
jgi:hypothetical protein